MKAGAGIFLGALLLRAIAVLAFPSLIPESDDKRYRYDPIAMNLLEGQGFGFDEEPTAVTGPAYPSVLA